MSISLNNHESRIKSLEELTGTSGIFLKRKYRNGITFYFEFTTGLKIQGGRIVCGDRNYNSITYPLPFSDTNYIILGTCTNVQCADWGNYKPYFSSFTTKNCNCSTFRAGDIRWIAIGILYTYRYIIKSISKFTSSILSRRRCESRDVY